jgi:G3E family GTPase
LSWGIDGEFLQGFRIPIFELTIVCMYCTIRADLIGTVKEILDRFYPGRIFIEATGGADPFEFAGLMESSQLEN